MPDLLFYDGHCGLCHAAVKFVIARDPDGRAFRFAPLQGELFQVRVSPEQRMSMPDSMVVQTSNGQLLMQSDAWVYILRQIGGWWKLAAAVMRLIPRPVRDYGYSVVARTRRLIAGRRDDLCPVIPAQLRSRFHLESKL